MINKLFRNSIVRNNILYTISFCLFIFTYIYALQIDLITLQFQFICKDFITCNDFVISLLCTLLCLFISFITFLFFRKKKEYYYLSYAPSLFFLGILTSYGEPFIKTFLLSFLFIALYTLIILQKNRKIRILFIDRYTFNKAIWKDEMVALMFCLGTCLLGNTKEMTHYRIKMERLILKGEYSKVYLVSNKLVHLDSSTTLLRAYSLNKQGKLGELFFSSSISMGSQFFNAEPLFSYSKNENIGALHLKRINKSEKEEIYERLETLVKGKKERKFWEDYLLIACLSDKNLELFVKLLPQYYTINTTLPKHYREALLWYTHTHTHPTIVYSDNILEADYQDYIKLEKGIFNLNERKNKLKDTYGNTYWFYFQYATI